MKNIPLNQLKPAGNNVRQVAPDTAQMKSLMASITSQGMLHNLVVMKNGSGYEVIDGNRRLACLRKIYGKSSDQTVPCSIIKDGDRMVGLHANMMREDMHPLDQCDVINELCSSGSHDFDTIAAQFGQTKKWVEQRIALSELSDTARTRFQNCDFTLGVAMALTLGSHERQDAFLEKFTEDMRITPDAARSAMTNQKIPVEKALFKLTPAIERDLGVEADLFGDDRYITNIDGFQARQHEVVETHAEELRQRNFLRVEVLYDQYPWEHRDFKNLRRIYDEDDMDVETTVAVVVYNSHRCAMDVQFFQDPQSMTQAELEAAESGEPVELTLADMSNPQRQMFEQMKANAVREWLLKNNKDAFLAMVVEAAYHNYTRTGTTRASDVTFNRKDEFSDELTPEWYEENEIYADADKLHLTVVEAYEDVDRHPLDYFLGNDTDWLLEKLLPHIARSIPTHVLNDERIISSVGFDTPTDKWFRPDAKFLSKYKVAQLFTLYTEVLGKPPLQDQSKKAYIDAILTVMQNRQTSFDPHDYTVDNEKATKAA